MTTFLFVVAGWFVFLAVFTWGWSRYMRWLDRQPYDWDGDGF